MFIFIIIFFGITCFEARLQRASERGSREMMMMTEQLQPATHEGVGVDDDNTLNEMLLISLARYEIESKNK